MQNTDSGRAMRALSLISILSAGLSLSACGGSSETPSADTPAPGFTLAGMNVAVADPALPRPSGKACSVQLFTDKTFNNFSSQSFSYQPACAGPWAKVMLEADFSVNAGRQFDRTGHISLGGVILYTGTTQEPSALNAASWHVEVDVSDYQSLFKQAQNGAVDLDNLVNETYTGILKGSARLVFYPQADGTDSARPRLADQVYSLSSRDDGRPDTLNKPDDLLTKTLNLPQNSVRAYLDIVAQGQSEDEFWYTCATDARKDVLQTCGNTPLRQVQVFIDDQPAGLAPAFPWMFTGAVNPRLWRPIPGVQALNFQPYRLDLSPFVGLLNDGRPHKFAIGVQNASNYFNVSANLLLFRDPRLARVEGRVLANSLGRDVTPQIEDKINASAEVSGSLNTFSNTDYQISGEIISSNGREQLQVTQNMAYENRQSFEGPQQNFRQVVNLDTSSSVSTAYASASLRRQSRMPLDLFYRDDGKAVSVQMRSALQTYQTLNMNGQRLFFNEIRSDMNTSAQRPAPGASYSSSAGQVYSYTDSLGSCYLRRVQAVDAKLVSAVDDKACKVRQILEKPWGNAGGEWGDYWLALGR